MTATTEPPAGGGGPSEPSGGSAPATGAPDGGASLIGTSSSYLCSNCSAELAIDQQYCVECGTRRGKPRFTLAAPSVGETAVVAVAPVGLPLPGGLPARVTALLAVIAVLLALGVGVLIGESGNRVKVSTVTVATGGASATGSSPSSSTAGGSAGKAGTTTTSAKSSSGSSKSSGSGSGNFFGN